MEKTIKEWLEELPEPYRSQALKNSAATPQLLKDRNKFKTRTMSSSIRCAFIWSEALEGREYWSEYHESVLLIENKSPAQ